MPPLLPCVVHCDLQTLTLGFPMADMVQEVVALVSNTHAPDKYFGYCGTFLKHVLGLLRPIFEALFPHTSFPAGPSPYLVALLGGYHIFENLK